MAISDLMRFVTEVIIIDGFLEEVKIFVKGIIICIVNSGFVHSLSRFDGYIWVAISKSLPPCQTGASIL